MSVLLLRWKDSCVSFLRAKTRGVLFGGWQISMSVLLLLIGATLLRWRLHVPICLSAAYPQLRADAWGPFAGVWLVGLVLTHLVVQVALLAARHLLRMPRLPLPTPDYLYAPVLIGTAEMILYPAALLAAAPVFVGIWLGIKVAVQWKHWQEEPPLPSPQPSPGGYRRFQLFLLGNALSLICALVLFAFLRARLELGKTRSSPPLAHCAVCVLVDGDVVSGIIRPVL